MAMDIQRPASVARQKKLRQIAIAAVAVIVIGLVSVVLARRSPPHPPSIGQPSGLTR